VLIPKSGKRAYKVLDAFESYLILQEAFEQPFGFVTIEGQWYVELHSGGRRRGFTVMALNGAIGEKVSPHCTCANARCLSYADNGISESDVNMGLVGCNKFAAGIGR
jgi:hypothetical protein